MFMNLALLKKGNDYGRIKPAYELAKEAEKVYNLYGMSKWERFKLEVYSGEFF